MWLFNVTELSRYINFKIEFISQKLSTKLQQFDWKQLFYLHFSTKNKLPPLAKFSHKQYKQQQKFRSAIGREFSRLTKRRCVRFDRKPYTMCRRRDAHGKSWVGVNAMLSSGTYLLKVSDISTARTFIFILGLACYQWQKMTTTMVTCCCSPWS